MENQKIGNFLSGTGEKAYFLSLGMGLNFDRVIESPDPFMSNGITFIRWINPFQI